MTKVAFDQLLQVTAPPPRNTLSPDDNSADIFRSHLDRAASVAAPKETASDLESDASTVEENESLEVAGEREENATTEQEETSSDSDPGQAKSASEEEPVAKEDSETEDEVILSSAAGTSAVEQAANAEVKAGIGITEGTDTSQQDLQQQSQEQTTEIQAETALTNGTTEPSEFEQLPTNPSELANQPEEQQANEEAAKRHDGTSQRAVINAATSTSAALADTEQVKHPSQQQSNARTQDPQTAQESLLQTLPENDANQDTRTPSQSEPSISSFSQPVELPLAVESDLATATANSQPEAYAPTTSQSSNLDPIAGLEKTLGSVAASKVASSAGGTSDPSTSEMPTVDRVRFVQRVGGAIRSAQQRDGQIQLRLSPPELGTLKIQLTVNEGAITANLETETAAARSVLLDNLPALRERLAEQGITIEKFDVDVGREGQQQADNPDASEREAEGSKNENNMSSEKSNARQTATTNPELQTTSAIPQSGLDIRI